MEYTELGPKYRPCEVLDLDLESGRGTFKMYIGDHSPHRLTVDGADHCDTCTLLSVVYHATCMLDRGDMIGHGAAW
jgi:hypothetical protein